MIAIFDSGSGGMSVFNLLKQHAPAIPITYFADHEHLPYGDKSKQELTKRVGEVVRGILRESAAPLIFSACHTASTVLPNSPAVIGMIQPTRLLLQKQQPTYVLILATQATHDSGIYQNMLEELGINGSVRACPGLADAIEHKDTPAFAQIMQNILKEAHAASASHIALCCTHYSLVAQEISEIFKPHDVHILDPAPEAAAMIMQSLPQKNDTP